MSYVLPPHLTLRPIDEKDRLFICALYADMRDDLRQLPLPPAGLEQLIAFQQQVHENGQRAAFPNAQYLLLEHHGRPVGKSVVADTPDGLHLVELAILSRERRQGFACAMLRALQQRAANQGSRMRLTVACNNQAALRLYARLGFQPCGGDLVHTQLAWAP
jgi:ribosomal protein S18 acetylase RimI-like enzyme